MPTNKILIGPSSFAATDREAMDRLLAAGCEVVPNPHGRKLTKDEMFGLLTDDVVGLIAGLEPLDEEVLSRSRLKVISRVGSGVSNIDLEAAKRLKVAVRTTPTGPVEAVAELTLGALLCLLREISAFDRDIGAGTWKKRTGVQLEGKTVAIVGFGRIGRRVAELLRPFNVRLLAVDPNLAVETDGVPVMPLAQALREADVVTLHCAGEAQLIGADELGAMKPGSYLLNAARGGLVDESALLAALDSEKLAGAWLDTYAKEPYNGPLADHPRVLTTPHVGSYTRECRKSMELEAVENLLSALREL